MTLQIHILNVFSSKLSNSTSYLVVVVVSFSLSRHMQKYYLDWLNNAFFLISSSSSSIYNSTIRRFIVQLLTASLHNAQKK
jgi:hypothetical protein